MANGLMFACPQAANKTIKNGNKQTLRWKATVSARAVVMGVTSPQAHESVRVQHHPFASREPTGGTSCSRQPLRAELHSGARARSYLSASRGLPRTKDESFHGRDARSGIPAHPQERAVGRCDGVWLGSEGNHKRLQAAIRLNASPLRWHNTLFSSRGVGQCFTGGDFRYVHRPIGIDVMRLVLLRADDERRAFHM